MSDPVVLLSTGDVVGPAGGVTDNSMVLFSGTSGKLIKGNNAVVTAAGLALLDDVNAAAQRVTLGLGTAATATLTTSSTDGTVGRMLKVGDFGFGAPALGSYGQDLNNYKTSGFYRVNPGSGTISNSPLGGFGDVILLVTNAIDLNSQTLWSYYSGAMYTRTCVGENWTPWQQVQTSATALGVGQTWQNVFSQRVIGTTYTNTTGRPIQVSIWQVFDSNPALIVDGVTVATIDGTPGAVGVQATAIVPQNSTYRVTAAVSGWAELR